MNKYLLVLAIILLTGCKSETSSSDGGSRGITELFTYALKTSMCSNLKRCYPDHLPDNCADAILNADNITSELQLDVSNFPTLSELIDAELTESILPNEAKLIPCMDEINNLSCANTYMVNAFATADPTNFNNAYQLLNASGFCKEIY